MVVAAAIIIAFGMQAAAPVLVPILLAVMIAAATTPLVSLIGRSGLPRPAAVVVTIILVLAVLTGLGTLISVAASDMTDSLPRLETTARGLQRSVVLWLQTHGLLDLAHSAAAFDAREIGAKMLADVLVGASGVLSSSGVVLFLVLFLLLEAATFRRKLKRALQWYPDRFEDVQQTVAEVQKYLFLKTLTCAATGIPCGAWCAMMGMSNAALWGLVTFLLNYVPILGSAVVSVLAALVATVQLGPAAGLSVLAGFTVVNVVIGYLVEPRILGRAAGLSPLVVIVSILVWGWLLGPLGALLSVPLTMVIKIVLAHTAEMRWLAILFGPGEGKDEEEYAEERRLSRLTRVSQAPPPPATASSRHLDATPVAVGPASGRSRGAPSKRQP